MPAPYPEPSLLPGEVTIAQAENVLKFNTLSELNKGISGTLICTNFKLSFLTAESFSSNLVRLFPFITLLLIYYICFCNYIQIFLWQSYVSVCN